jgi:hypothetical protein
METGAPPFHAQVHDSGIERKRGGVPMMVKSRHVLLLAIFTLLVPGVVQAFQFQASESVSGNLDMQLTLGAGFRLGKQSPNLVGDPTRVPGANTAQSSNGDDGDLNYNKHDFYATYLKFTPELLLKFPQDFKFMARGTALYDFKATDTQRTDLSDSAKNQVARDVRLLDLWVSKDMNISGQRARIRVGNQVINWGESIFAIGGINATNTLDFQKIQVPGTQLKEAVLPAPIVSVASGLGHGLNAEAYYQFYWYENRLPPVGTYFSVADILGGGRGGPFARGGRTGGRQSLFLNFDPASPGFVNFGGLDPAAGGTIFDGVSGTTLAVPFVQDKTAKDGGQYGIALHYKPEGLRLDLGFYFINYHDKMPVLNLLSNATTLQWEYLENRKMYGVSANFPVGNWAVGMEASYRPKEAVSLSACFNAGGSLDAILNTAPVDCPMFIDQKKYQFILTGILAMTPGDHGWFLDLLRAQTATFTGEAVWIHFPGVDPDKRFGRTIGGVAVDQVPAAGYGFWKGTPILQDIGAGLGTLPYDTVAGVGDGDSYGFTVDFNWAYDNKIIKGWQVIPGLTYFQALGGMTPTLTANYFSGAKSVNVYVLFNQNPPSKWQAGLNFTNYWGNNQLLADRDFLGGFLTRNF